MVWCGGYVSLVTENEHPGDALHLEEIELQARLGVPDDERAQPQRLVLCLTLWPRRDFGRLRDDISQAVDYATVVQTVEELVGGRADRLLETLADAIASHLLQEFALNRVRVELRKFVLPCTRHVAAVVTRSGSEE